MSHTISSTEPKTDISFDDEQFSSYIFQELRNISFDGEGVTRGSYSETETKALQFLEKIAIENGLSVTHDEASNYVFSLPEDKDADRFVLVGSHIDSVPQGGNYDGAAGIVAGIICLLRAIKTGVSFSQPVKVIAMRGEESAWFGCCYVGSRALFGQLTSVDLNSPHRNTGKPLRHYMAKLGIDVSKLENQEPLLDSKSILSYLELHIEQGPVLVKTNRPMAIVSGIRGNSRYREINCIGEAGHSGAVPREYRHDAVFAVSSLLVRLDDHWKTLLAHSADLVITSGILSTNCKDHAMSRIPGEVSFSFEARSEHVDVLNTMSSLLESEAKIIERERNVKFDLNEKTSSSPALLDPVIVNSLKAAAIANGYEDYVMASGAGHDAAVFSNLGIPSGMIFIRNEHGSHNPDEAMEISDFLVGTSVMFRHLCEGVNDNS